MQLTSNSDKITRDFFDSLLIETRYLDAVLPTTEMTLFGESFRTPIMTAALSHLHNTAQNGMTIYAQAAAQSGAVHWVGMGGDEELEDIVATGARTIKIIKPHADNREVLRKSPHDAEKCLKAGCAGLVVSHHHGMVQYAVPPLMALPEILSATGGSVPVFVDCGIESGMDAYKCLALGAKAVSVGRHLMPLLKSGADAVAGRINEMTAELAGVMARTGISTLDRMDSTIIHRRAF